MTTLAHGWVRYRKGCRCFTCRLAKSEYEQQRLAGELAGCVDAGPAREHLAALRAAGFGLRRIVVETGVSRSALQRLSVQATVHKTTETRLLSMPLVEAPKPKRFISAVGTHRRVQALCTLGWSPRSQIQRAGLAQAGSTRLLAGAQVWPRTAEKVRRLYDELSMKPAPPSRAATRARQRAVGQRFFPPLAWDDETIDDPAALPCLLPPVEPVDPALELAVQHVVARHDVPVTPAVRREIVRRWPDARRSELASVCRCHVEVIRRIRQTLAASC